MSDARERDERQWGRYVVLEEGPGFKVKRIDVDPEARLSYQRHASRSEHWLIVAGRGIVTIEGRDHAVAPGSAVDVPVGSAHRIANNGNETLIFIEVQRGHYLGEDDIVRIADDYGRA